MWQFHKYRYKFKYMVAIIARNDPTHYRLASIVLMYLPHFIVLDIDSYLRT